MNDDAQNFENRRRYDPERDVNAALAAHVGRLTADFVRADLIAQQYAQETAALQEALASAHATIDRLTARLALEGDSPAQDARLIAD